MGPVAWSVFSKGHSSGLSVVAPVLVEMCVGLCQVDGSRGLVSSGVWEQRRLARRPGVVFASGAGLGLGFWLGSK